MTTVFDFNLVFALPDGGGKAEAYLDALFEAGCDDATIGLAVPGRIALAFSREATSADAAIKSAIQAVCKAVPGARLIEAGPDLVNLAEIADVVGFSRQNMQKYATGKIRQIEAPFAPPVVSGAPSLYRLYEVCQWLRRHTDISLGQHICDLSLQTARLNMKLQQQRLRRSG